MPDMTALKAVPISAPADGETVEFRSGFARLSGTLFRPSQKVSKAIILHSATGVPHRYYRHFAAWLSQDQSAMVLIYDYRDFGASRYQSTRKSVSTMRDWMVHDQSAAQAYLRKLCPLWVIGHSLGGLGLPLQDQAHQIERAIFVASGAVHISDHPWSYWPMPLSFWYGHGALTTKLFGHMPGWALGQREGIPKGVYDQWRGWCTRRDFMDRDIADGLLPRPDPDRVKARIKFVAVSDDVMVPPRAVWRLMQQYPEAKKSQLTLKPRAFGLRKIGHIAAFSRAAMACWPSIVDDRN
jgi:predicted alpha/beta hydrolase